MMAAHIMAADDDFLSVPGGTGDRFARAVVILAGVAALFATLVTAVFVCPPPRPYCTDMLSQVGVASNVGSLPLARDVNLLMLLVLQKELSEADAAEIRSAHPAHVRSAARLKTTAD